MTIAHRSKMTVIGKFDMVSKNYIPYSNFFKQLFEEI